MRVCSRLVPWAAVLLVVLSTSWPSSAQHSTSESVQTDRLVTLAKLWAAVKYFHPYLAYRTDIDWDQALVKAIPKVNAARNTAEYAAAIEAKVFVPDIAELAVDDERSDDQEKRDGELEDDEGAP